jgi:hypothetical protein
MTGTSRVADATASFQQRKTRHGWDERVAEHDLGSLAVRAGVWCIERDKRAFIPFAIEQELQERTEVRVIVQYQAAPSRPRHKVSGHSTIHAAAARPRQSPPQSASVLRYAGGRRGYDK